MAFFKSVIDKYKQENQQVKEQETQAGINTSGQFSLVSQPQEGLQSTIPKPEIPVISKIQKIGEKVGAFVASKPAEFKPIETFPVDEAEQRKSNIEKLNQFIQDDQAISQGTSDPIKEKKIKLAKTVPVLGEFIFGRQGSEAPLYERGSFQQQIVDQGIYGFLTEGFGARFDPDRAQVGEQIDNRYQKLKAEGYSEKDALDVAVADVIKDARGSAQNIADLKDPSRILTEKEKDILYWTNTLEDVFAVLDAPITMGSTKAVGEGAEKLITPAGKELQTTIESARDAIIKAFETPTKLGGQKVDILKETDVVEGTSQIEEYIQFLEETDEVSLSDIQKGVELLQEQGKDTTKITTPVNELISKIKQDASPYIQDPVTGKMMGRKKGFSDIQPAGTVAPQPFANEGDVTTKILTELQGKSTVDKQFLSDLTNQGNIKQAERDVIREVLAEYPDGKINAKEFGEKVQSRLLPLNSGDITKGDVITQYESVSLPDDVRGDVANYSERIYESPIETSAGGVHFDSDQIPNYFAHTRIEDMADNSTRRVIEVQSDLFQKGRLETEYGGSRAAKRLSDNQGYLDVVKKIDTGRADELAAREAELAQLQPYRNTWWERIVREEVKKAAQDGKSVLQFPTGETAMKIEGLGDNANWFHRVEGQELPIKIKPEELEIGKEIYVGDNVGYNPDAWTITEVLGDGKFKAVSKSTLNKIEADSEPNWIFQLETPDGDVLPPGSKSKNPDAVMVARNTKNGKMDYVEFSAGKEDNAIEVLKMRNVYRKTQEEIYRDYSETFDISGKVDTNNPIYKFYEKDVQKYLAKNYGATKITDANGVSWIQLNVDPKLAGKPVEAFAGGIAGIEEDENGDIQVDPTKAFLGIAAAGILGKGFINRQSLDRKTADLGADASRLAQRGLPEKTPLPTKGQTQYPLSSEKLSASLSSEYQNVAGKSIDDVDKVLSPTEINPKKLKEYGSFRKAINDTWTNVVEYIQDDMVRVRQLVNDPNVKVSDDTDPYLAEVLFHGRVGARLQETRDAIISIDKDVVSTAKRNGVPDSDMSLMVNKYLHARHTPERNAKLGDGAAGLTDAEATEILQDIDSLPYADDVKRIADQVQTINNQTLDVLRDAQVIDEELYKTLRETYKNHVPLQRILDETEDVSQALTSKGFDVRSTGIKRAKGSERQVADIFANVVTNYEQAVIRAEKNRVDLATLQFARDNPQLGLFKEVKPKAIGKTFDDKLIFEQVTDPNILTLRENGKPVHLKIADENLALALKGINRHQVPPFMKFIQSFTRFYSGLQTRFNPEFAFPNKIRDLQEAVVYAGSRADLGFKGGVKASLDQKAYKDVWDYLRGNNTDGAKLYKQMIEDGGTTGGMSLSTREQVELDIAEIRQLNRSTPRQAARKFIDSIDNFNQIVEDSTRLSLYKQALDRGVSRKRAAEIAKEASVNFNKFGKGGPIINSLYMFSNASIQGTTKMLRAMKNPKVAGVVAASVGSAVWATGEWNDRIDPDWRDKVTEWDRMNSLVVVVPTTDDKFEYVSIPVGWGIKPIKVSMDYAYDLTQGKGQGATDVASGIMAAIINSYNPVGGTDPYSSVTPTILDIPSEIARNKAWHGGKIKPDWDQNAPESIRYFTSLKDSTTGETAIQFSEGLSGIGVEISPADIYYAYQGYIGGAGRTATDFVNTMIKAGQFEMPDQNDIPIWSRFVKQRDNEEIGAASREYEAIKKKLEEQSRDRFYLKQDAENAYAQLRQLPQEEAAQRFDEIAERDSALAEKIVDIINDEKLGLTFTERLIKQLGVENGERAQYIYEKLEKLETKEEKAALWDEYSEKGIITKNVSEQLMELYQ